MRIIINADDLGISQGVNDAVFGLISAGRITSATLLANGPALPDAISRVCLFPSISFGIHLNLTQFAPLSDRARRLLPLDRNQCLHRELLSMQAALRWLPVLHHELRTQIEYLLDLGVPISHFDSHHHVHTHPILFASLKSLQKRYGIRHVRLTKNLYAPNQPVSRTQRASKYLWNSTLRKVFRTHTTDRFTEFTTFLELAKVGLPNHVSLEVMTHPGHPAYHGESEILRSDWQSYLLPLHVEPISYLDLPK